ncbi:hypothetical protein BN2537_11681 [Streptomyces venezuelae]|nr:hypothetical protein BN2537_11681 [Streptomyces venezuelae]
MGRDGGGVGHAASVGQACYAGRRPVLRARCHALRRGSCHG